MGMLKLGSSYPGWPCYALGLDCCWWEANNKLLSILLYTFGTTCKQMCPCLSLYGSFMLIPIQKLWIEVNNALSGFGSWFLSLFQIMGRSNLFIFLKKIIIGLPWWRSGWGSACQCRGHGFGPWSRKIPRAAEQLSPCATTAEPVLWSPRATTTEPACSNYWGPCA